MNIENFHDKLRDQSIENRLRVGAVSTVAGRTRLPRNIGGLATGTGLCRVRDTRTKAGGSGGATGRVLRILSTAIEPV